jgi:hypothetical protein
VGNHLLAILCILLVSAGAGAQDPNPQMSKLAWIAGCWKGGDKTQKEEQWTKLAGGTMLGVGRTIKDGKTITYDFLQIREKGPEILLIAHPDGGAAVYFKLGTVSDSEAVFENDTIKFPRRIRYQRQADGSLIVAIEGKEEDRQKRYESPMQRVKCD